MQAIAAMKLGVMASLAWGAEATLQGVRELGLPTCQVSCWNLALVEKLKDLGYAGALTIERESSGPRQIEDIRRAIRLQEPLCTG